MTHFLNNPVYYRYPDGLIMPLVYGLKGLMDIDGESVVWTTDRHVFLKRYLVDIAGAYSLVLDIARFAPPTVAKNRTIHDLSVVEFGESTERPRGKEVRTRSDR